MEQKQEKQTTFKSELISWIKHLAVAVVLVLIINNLLIVNAFIPSGSMETTLMPGDRVFANRLAYLGSKQPERYDIIVFKFPDDESQNYVKRVIGLPGETVEEIQGIVYIDGERIEDTSYISERDQENFGPVTVPEDHYFVMGDCRINSLDSRYWEDKFVAENKILGKAGLRYYPSIGMIK